jgi:hypothetical protein
MATIILEAEHKRGCVENECPRCTNNTLELIDMIRDYLIDNPKAHSKICSIWSGADTKVLTAFARQYKLTYKQWLKFQDEDRHRTLHYYVAHILLTPPVKEKKKRRKTIMVTDSEEED